MSTGGKQDWGIKHCGLGMGVAADQGRETSFGLAEGTHTDHSFTEWVRFESTTVVPKSLLKQDHPGAHFTGS